MTESEKKSLEKQLELFDLAQEKIEDASKFIRE